MLLPPLAVPPRLTGATRLERPWGRWRRLKNALLYLLARVGVGLLSRTPRSAVAPLGRFLGRCGWALAGRERRRAQRNLLAAPLALDAAQRGRLVREVFENLGVGVLEALALDRRRAELSAEHPWVRIADGERALLRRAAERGRGAVFVTAHVGNFELLAAAIAELYGPVHVLARRSYDPRLTRLLEQRRQRCGVRPLWVEDSGHLVQALRVLRAGGWLGLLLDQPPRGPAPLLPFLGRPAPTSTLAARLCRSQGAALLVGFLRRGGEPGGAASHELRLEEITPEEITLDDDALGHDERVTAALNARIEAEVLARPADWLWTLDRWRDARESRDV